MESLNAKRDERIVKENQNPKNSVQPWVAEVGETFVSVHLMVNTNRFCFHLVYLGVALIPEL